MRWWSARGLVARLLWPLSLVYRSATAVDRLRYRCGLAKVERLPVPVIVIGNWITGGAGKTPTLLALLAQLQAWGLRAGVVSRGYGRRSQGVVLAPASSEQLGDEPTLIHRRSRAPLAVGERRAEAARALLAQHRELQLIVCDDGLQHHALARDLELWVFDRRGLGNGYLLPAGPLRQDHAPAPITQPGPQHIVLYSEGHASTELPGFMATRQLCGAMPLAAWWQGAPSLTPFAALPRHDWRACAGLASPEAFFDALRAQGLPVQGLPLGDHADFHDLPWPPGAPVLVTEKDAVKLAANRPGCEQVWVVPLDLLPEPAFAAALKAHLKALLPAWTPD